MSKNLVISRGTLRKFAQGQPGEGPSFEQQFGILANAQITDKYPALGPYKVLFQLQDKTDDNLFAVGSAVYKLGDNFIYIPAVFKKGKIWTGVIQFVPSMQRFLPLSDAWLSYVKNHKVSSSGDTIPAQMGQDIATGSDSARARQVTDPFMKTASEKTIFDTVFSLGKKASQLVLDKLNDIDFLNSALAFYQPEQLQTFAKKASAQFQQIKPYIVTVLDKRAAYLTNSQKQQLFKDGFIIKTAEHVSSDQASNHVTVIKKNNPRTSFSKPNKSCKCKVLTVDGQLQDVTLLKTVKYNNSCDLVGITPVNPGFSARRDIPAKVYMNNNTDIKYYAITQNGCSPCSSQIMVLTDSIQDIDFKSIGKDITQLKEIPYGTIIVTPQGAALQLNDRFNRQNSNKFFSYNQVLTISQEDDLIKPLSTGSTLELPKGSRAVFVGDRYKVDGTLKEHDSFNNVHTINQFATDGLSIDSVIRKFVQNNYSKVKVYTDGQQFTITSDKQPGTDRLQVKQAALRLVTDYNVSPGDAKAMLKQVLDKQAQLHRSTTESFLLQKKAAIAGDSSDWQQANIGMTVKSQTQPSISKKDLNNYAQNSQQLMNTIQAAVDVGVRQVFDMQVLKLLLQTADPRQQIQQAIPDFMNCIDKLCRILFLYHSHTQDMEEQYGAVKMQALAKSLQNTLKDLSELAVFLKLRGLSNDTNNNPDVGDLQTGTYL